MIIEVGKSQKDIERAVVLIQNTFGYSHAFFNKSYLIDDPDFSLMDLILCKNERDDVIGVVRIQPKIIYKKKTKYKSAGINFVCISDKYQGKKLSVPIMLFALNEIKERGFDISYVIARKAVDNYYNKFGYWGASSYQKIKIKSIKSKINEYFTIKNEFDNDLINIYKKSYEESYALCFGRSLRETANWIYYSKLIKKIENTVFNTIYCDKNPIGYYIEKNNDILEIAILDDYLGEEIFIESSILKNDNTIIEIPFEHSIIPHIAKMDVTYYSRRCLNGGHMLKIMGEQSENKMSFEEFQESIQINVGLPTKNSKYSYFNINYLDQW